MLRTRPYWIGLVTGVLIGASLTLAIGFATRPIPAVAPMSRAARPVSPKPETSVTLGRQTELIGKYRSFLALNVDGASYDPRLMAEMTIWLEEQGFGARESEETVRGLVSMNVRPQMLGRYVFTSAAVTRAKGTYLAPMSQTIAAGVSRGYDACADLDNDINFLSAEERSRIRNLFDQGHGEEARMACFEGLEVRATTAFAAGA